MLLWWCWAMFAESVSSVCLLKVSVPSTKPCPGFRRPPKYQSRLTELVLRVSWTDESFVDKSFVDKSFVDKSFVDRVSWTDGTGTLTRAWLTGSFVKVPFPSVHKTFTKPCPQNLCPQNLTKPPQNLTKPSTRTEEPQGLNRLRKKDDLYRWEKEERTSGPKGRMILLGLWSHATARHFQVRPSCAVMRDASAKDAVNARAPRRRSWRRHPSDCLRRETCESSR